MEKEVLEVFEAAKKAADAAVDGGASPEEDRCVDALNALMKMTVTTDILVRTQVGKRLRPLAKHPQKKIQSVASDLLKHWKSVVIEETSKSDKQTPNSEVSTKVNTKVEKSHHIKAGNLSKDPAAKGIEVDKHTPDDAVMTEQMMKYDTLKVVKKGPCPAKPTSVIKCNDSTRDKLREILAEAFSKVCKETSESSKEEVRNMLEEVKACDPYHVAVALETSMHEKLGSSTGSHKMKYRSIMFNLKDSKNPDFRRRVLLGQIKPDKLVDLTPEDMASDDRRKEINQIKEKAMFECERGSAPTATTDQFKCKRCGQRKTTYYQMQTRSADEPMTTYVTCVNCDYHWKFC